MCLVDMIDLDFYADEKNRNTCYYYCVLWFILRMCLVDTNDVDFYPDEKNRNACYYYSLSCGVL